MGSNAFGNPLTDLKIMAAIPDVARDRKGVNKVVGQFGKFNHDAALSIAAALEKHVSGPAFPARQREAAILTIRTAAMKQIR